MSTGLLIFVFNCPIKTRHYIILTWTRTILFRRAPPPPTTIPLPEIANGSCVSTLAGYTQLPRRRSLIIVYEAYTAARANYVRVMRERVCFYGFLPLSEVWLDIIIRFYEIRILWITKDGKNAVKFSEITILQKIIVLVLMQTVWVKLNETLMRRSQEDLETFFERVFVFVVTLCRTFYLRITVSTYCYSFKILYKKFPLVNFLIIVPFFKCTAYLLIIKK